MAAYTTIDKPSDYFNTVLYTGDGSSSRNITGVGFQPNWVWFKQRSGTQPHTAIDSVRTGDSKLRINVNSAEFTGQGYNFNSDGFGWTSQDDESNENSETYVAWNWKETATAGFDIVSYTGNDSAGRTISHSLSAVPKMMIVKCRNVGKEWTVFHASLGNGKFIELDQTTAVQTATNRWNDTSPTSSVFSVGVDSSVNASDQTYIAYLFSEKKGYSKFGSYTGNGNADGPFIFTGFKPAWIITKSTGATGGWEMHDNKRSPFNSSKERLFAHDSNEEVIQDPFVDLLSNGFKIRATVGNINASTDYIFMAFAENPFVTSTGIPTTAR